MGQNIFYRLINKIRNQVWSWRHEQLMKTYQKRLIRKDTTIISMNCTGGILSHDLNLKFLSPTVNLYFRAEDFIKFCERLDYYLSIDTFTECKDPKIVGDRKYPIAYLDDIVVFFVHYKSFSEAVSKWNERKKRVNKDNIAIFNTDREGMTESLKQRFEKLPYRKVMFVNHPQPKYKSCFYIPGYESEQSVGIITDHDSWDGKRPIDIFDWVTFLNGDF